MNSISHLFRGLLAAAAVAIAAVGVSASNSIHPAPDIEEITKENLLQTLTLQMQTYRWELAALARTLPPEDPRYATAHALIRRGEQLIHRMRAAHPMELNAIRSDYEKIRADLDRALGRGPAGAR